MENYSATKFPSLDHAYYTEDCGLKRYYPIWFTSSLIPSPVTPIHRVILHSVRFSLTCIPNIQQQSRSFTSPHFILTTTQFSLPPHLNNGVQTRNTFTTLNRKRSLISPLPAKRYTILPPYHDHRKKNTAVQHMIATPDNRPILQQK